MIIICLIVFYHCNRFINPWAVQVFGDNVAIAVKFKQDVFAVIDISLNSDCASDSVGNRFFYPPAKGVIFISYELGVRCCELNKTILGIINITRCASAVGLTHHIPICIKGKARAVLCQQLIAIVVSITPLLYVCQPVALAQTAQARSCGQSDRTTFTS